MTERRKGRILAFQALYAWELNEVGAEELMSFDWLDEDRRSQYSSEVLTFARLITKGALENLEAIDSVIGRRLEHWDLSRLSKVDLSLLRLGAYSLLYQRDIPASVTIDEAVEIAKEYGKDESFKFVNGVLDGIRKHLGDDG